MDLVTVYPYDPTGRAASNRVVNQPLTVSPSVEIKDYSYVIPRGAPYFAESLVVRDGQGTGARVLVENVDYWCVIDFLSASIALSKRISVGIALINPLYSGTLHVSYQALGGNYTLDDFSILEELVRKRYVVRHVSYEQVVNLPAGFAPSWHAHEVGDMVGMSQVVDTLGGVKTAIEGRQGSFSQLSTQLSSHVNGVAVHTPAQVGLGNVKNYSVGTMADVNNGLSNKYITADILRQYVTGQGTDTSGFLTGTAAALIYVTKSELNSYQTTSTADGKYALKNDVYTKAQVNALLAGYDAGTTFDDYYNRTQSDLRYATKTEFGDYLKSSTAASTYVSKIDIQQYLTTSQADSKYAAKTDIYTRVQADDRYMLKTAISNYLSVSDGDSKYQSKTAMSNYYTKIEVNGHKLSGGTLSDGTTTDYNLTLTESLAAGGTSNVVVPINLPLHVKKSEVYTKKETVDLIASSSMVHRISRVAANVAWPGYSNAGITWEITQIGKLFHFTCTNTNVFYYQEDNYLVSTKPKAAQAGNLGLKIKPISVSMSLNASEQTFNGFIRMLESCVYWDTVTGDISWWVNINHDQNAANKYVRESDFFVGVSIVATSTPMLDSLNALMERGSPVYF